MPEYVRALIVIVFFSVITFSVAKNALKGAVYTKLIQKWQIAWLLTLISAVFLHNFWIFSIAVLLIGWFSNRLYPENRLYFYLVLICALPLTRLIIPGFAGITYLMEWNYSRLMILALLLPLLFGNKKQELRAINVDRYVVLYLALISILLFRDNSPTNAIRLSLIEWIDIFIPYFAISKFVTNEQQLKNCLVAFFLGLSVFALIGVFEALRHWYLYVSTGHSIYGVLNAFYTDMRGGSLRARAVFTTPLAFGYAMVVAGGLLLYLKQSLRSKIYFYLAMSVVVLCLLATKARGPWIGFIIMLMTFSAIQKGGLKRVVGVIVLGGVSLLILNFTATGAKYIQMLPIIGSSNEGTIQYRTRLIENAWIVFKQHPIFGSTNFMDTPQMQSMRQGQGIIDLVNSYIQIALPYGSIGLAIFVMIFISIIFGAYKVSKSESIIQENMSLMGKALVAITVATFFTIGTVSSVDYIPVIYWVVIGMGAAYIKIAKDKIFFSSHQAQDVNA